MISLWMDVHRHALLSQYLKLFYNTLFPYMTGVECYKDFFVVEGREDGLDRIAIHRYDTPTVP